VQEAHAILDHGDLAGLRRIDAGVGVAIEADRGHRSGAGAYAAVGPRRTLKALGPLWSLRALESLRALARQQLPELVGHGQTIDIRDFGAPGLAVVGCQIVGVIPGQIGPPAGRIEAAGENLPPGGR
jgi:hypothetical protein